MSRYFSTVASHHAERLECTIDLDKVVWAEPDRDAPETDTRVVFGGTNVAMLTCTLALPYEEFVSHWCDMWEGHTRVNIKKDQI